MTKLRRHWEDSGARLRAAGLSHEPKPRQVRETVRVVASECDLYGHDYEVLEGDPMFVAGPRDPEEVFCSRCGKSWKVER